MYCARCGADVAARAVVCRTCGADLTRAGSLRMTAGGLYEHTADLGLPAGLVDRLNNESAMIEAARHEFARHQADEQAALQTRQIPKVGSTPTEPDDQVVAHPAVNPDANSTRKTIIATVLVVLLVVAALLLVNGLAQRLMDPLPPVGPAATPSASQTPTPGSTPT